MKVAGKYIIEATPKIIYKMITDHNILEKITPSVQSLKEIGKDKFKAISEVKVGPVRGSFEGELELKEKEEGKKVIVELNQKSKIGNAKAEISIHLTPQDNNKTEIQYTGDAQLSGMLGRMGQRIMSGVVSTLSKQFFEALEEEVKSQNNKNN